MRTRLIVATIFLLATSGSFIVEASDCGFLGLSTDEFQRLQDRDVYFRPLSETRWSKLEEPVAALAGRSVELAYVFLESFGTKHSGVIVVKSGRNKVSDEPRRGSKEKNIRLLRRFDNYCGVASQYDGQVSAKSYDDYHDQGLNGPEVSAIKSFHVRYEGRRGVCKATNESGIDSLVPYDPRSNRGQFSFNPRVVSEGTYSQVLAWAGITTALASSENYEDQRVEIKKYDIVAGTPACLRINLPAQKRGSFVRINDLEGLDPNNLFRRAGEKGWQLVP